MWYVCSGQLSLIPTAGREIGYRDYLMWVTKWRHKVRLTGAMVCLLAASLVQLSFSMCSLWLNKLCAWRHNMPRPSPLPVGSQAPRAPPSRRNVAVLSNAEYVPTLTATAALRVKAALSKTAWWPWPLTFWPWKWCPSHVWRGLSLCQFWSS